MKTIKADPCNRSEWIAALKASDKETVCITSGSARFIAFRRKILSSSGSPEVCVEPVKEDRGRGNRDGSPHDNARSIHHKLSEARCMSEDYRDEMRGDGHSYDEIDDRGLSDARRSRAKYE